MKFNFRQGVQSAPVVSGHPSFLTYNPGNNTITISVGVNLVRASIAYGSVNYLIEERETAVDAWGPMVWNSSWGPAPVGPFTAYLYWDVNLASGALTRGFTHLVPAFGVTAPASPGKDQHWFDTTANIMKVWDGVRWVQRARVFAGTFTGGSNVINENALGSQVGIVFTGSMDTWPDHGYILFGADQKGIRAADGTFVTTSQPIHTYHGSFSSPIRLELANSTALAGEPIPAFYAVSAVGNGQIRLASGSQVSARPIGIITVPANTGDAVDVVFKGIVYNDQWNWDYTLGCDLYCGSTGQLVQGPAGQQGSIRVGVIIDAHNVLIDVDLYGNTSAGGADWPLQAPVAFNEGGSDGRVPFSFIDSPTTGVQLTQQPEMQLKLHRDGNNSITLKKLVGAEAVEVTSDSHGLKLNTLLDYGKLASTDVHESAFDKDSLRGVIRSVEGRAQQKLELNSGNTFEDYLGVRSNSGELDGPMGYNAVSSAQHEVAVVETGSNPTLDFSLANTIVMYLDPMQSNGNINPANGLPGGQYEIVLKLSNPSPVMTAYYKFPQFDGEAFIGPLVVIANTGVRDVAVQTLTGFSGPMTSHTMVSGLPRKLLLTEKGNSNDAWTDVCFVATTNKGAIDFLADNHFGTRIFQDPQNQYTSASAIYLSSPSNGNGEFDGDGFMWWNSDNDVLLAASHSAPEVWAINCATGDPTEFWHYSEISNKQVVSATGSQAGNKFFTLETDGTSQVILKMFDIDLLVNTPQSPNLIRVLLIGVSGAILHFNEMVVDETNLEVVISIQIETGIEVTRVSFNGAPTVVSHRVILTSVKSTAPCKPVISGTDLYLPHESFVLKVDLGTLGVTTQYATVVKVHNLEFFEARNYIIGTTNHHLRTDYLRNQVGVFTLNLGNDQTLIRSALNATWASVPKIHALTGTVATYSQLPLEAFYGAVYYVTDSAEHWMSIGFDNWISLGAVYVSVCAAGDQDDTDGIYQLRPEDPFIGTLKGVYPQITSSIGSGPVRFPSHQIYANVNDSFDQIPFPNAYGQTWIVKLTKASYWDDRYHKNQFQWYCTGIVGPYENTV